LYPESILKLRRVGGDLGGFTAPSIAARRRFGRCRP